MNNSKEKLPRTKIGILGGTFNPIHNGHLELAQKAYIELGLDKVLIMPSGSSYMKSGVLSADMRVEMVKRAITEYDYFELSLIEVQRLGNTYTYETLEELKQISPESDYYFILGADSLFQISTWKNPERIFELSTIVCAVRDDFDINDIKSQGKILEKQGATIYYLSMPKIDISSSEIRTKVKNQLDISNLVPHSVLNYIEEEHLYEN